jgi:hypothetical protein
MRAGFVVFATAMVLLAGCKRPAEPSAAPAAPVPDLLETIGQLAAQGERLKSVPFPTVVEGTTGRRVIAVAVDEIAAQIVAAIGIAVGESCARLNRDDSPVRDLRRINEASRFFEDEILDRLNANDAFICELPPTAAGKAQRAGYPDLKITHRASGRIAYLDPKLFESGSRDSTLRTFYFAPKTETNKILDDAHHLLIGIEHDGNAGAWQFTNWHLVDLSKLVVRLKPEFQASNRNIYGEDAILQSGR